MPLCDPKGLIGALRAKGLRMSAAESCTGGLIGYTVTSLPGASDVFLGSAVTYSNESKERILGVPHDILEMHGAVSEETARSMAMGSIAAYGSDVSVAVTGIAGPGGATETKPVGLVFIAVSDGSRCIVSKFIFDGDRQSVRQQTADEAIRMLEDMLEGKL